MFGALITLFVVTDLVFDQSPASPSWPWLPALKYESSRPSYILVRHTPAVKPNIFPSQSPIALILLHRAAAGPAVTHLSSISF